MIRPGDLRPRLSASRGLSAFSHRNYRLFFAGQAVSLIGTWMQQVAQAWLVLVLTQDPLWLGVVAAAQFLPVLIFGLFAGVLADSLPKRQTLIATQVAKMGLSIVLAVIAATGYASVPLLIVLAIGIGLANAVDMPVRQAFAVEMVGQGDIGNAVALNSAMFNGARVVGPAVAGLLIGAVGVTMAFVIDAMSFLAVIAGLAMMRDEELHRTVRTVLPRSAGEVMTQLRGGLGYVRSTPLVLLSILTIGLAATFGMNFTVVIPPLAEDVLHSGASGYGFLMAASGVGSIVAALWLAFGRSARPRLIGIGAVLLGLGQVALGLSGSFAASMALMVIVGFGTILMAATANTTIQLAVPDALRGRVMSVYTTVIVGSTPIGGPLIGAMASVWGIAAAVALGGALAAAVGIGALVWLRHLGARATLAPIGQAPGAPSTRAAFSPPKPKEVDSTAA